VRKEETISRCPTTRKHLDPSTAQVFYSSSWPPRQSPRTLNPIPSFVIPLSPIPFAVTDGAGAGRGGGGGGADLAPADLEEAAGRARHAGMLLFFLVVRTVITDQIFTTSGEETRAFARSLKRYSILPFLSPSSQTQM
jgi:hypothetical protein